MNNQSTNLAFPGKYDFGRIASLIAVLVGVSVLVGWTLDVEFLKRIVPSLVAMNPVTAIAFIFLGVAVWASRYDNASGGSVTWARWAAGIVLIIGTLKLCEIVFGWQIGVDQILFQSRLEMDPTGVPNRMAPNTAFNFVLLSLALIFPWRRKNAHFDPSTVLITVSIFGSFLPVIGYLFGTKFFYGIGQYIPMAVHTALTFLMLGVGLLLARPERSVIATVFDTGMSGVMVRRLLPAVIVTPVAIGWLRLKGQSLGYYDNELGAALVVVTQVVLLVATVSWLSFFLLRLDKLRREAEARLSELVLTDDLTGLRNRRGFAFLAEQELKLARNKRMGIVLWCVYADLDGLKTINDTLGHDAGSAAIKHAAAVLRSSFRDSDIIARMGGDEFVVLAATNAPTDGTQLIERLKSNVAAFNERENLPYTLALSVGIIPVNTDDMQTVEEIVNGADAEMYLDKTARKKALPANTIASLAHSVFPY